MASEWALLFLLVGAAPVFFAARGRVRPTVLVVILSSPVKLDLRVITLTVLSASVSPQRDPPSISSPLGSQYRSGKIVR